MRNSNELNMRNETQFTRPLIVEWWFAALSWLRRGLRAMTAPGPSLDQVYQPSFIIGSDTTLLTDDGLMKSTKHSDGSSQPEFTFSSMTDPFPEQSQYSSVVVSGIQEPYGTSSKQQYADFVNMLVGWGMTAQYMDMDQPFNPLMTKPDTVYVRLGKLYTDVVLIGKNGIDLFTVRFKGGEVIVNGH